MPSLNLSLHPAQRKVFDGAQRFKVVAAGRRFGKTYLAITLLAVWGLGNQTTKKDLFYVAPTFQQAKDIVWENLKDVLRPVLASTHENTGVARLLNGVRIHLKGSDRPDTLRGVGLIGCVVDEYADMKPFVWEEILRPALSDVRGPALFIGTPKGRNHFYKLAKAAQRDDTGEWGYWHFTTYDNPFIHRDEIESAKRTLSTAAFNQEYMASFDAPTGNLFSREWIRYTKEPADGRFFLACDLAGFQDELENRNAKDKNLDESALALVKAYNDDRGDLRLWCREIFHGRWKVEETASKIITIARDHEVPVVGVERGMALQAVMPYMLEEMVRLRHHVRVEKLTHGNRNKIARITWALQGRLEHGTLTFREGAEDEPWMAAFQDQLLQFPDNLTHDDLPDALSYVDQLVSGAGNYTGWHEDSEDRFRPLDPRTGY
ncbi:Terminase-like family [uncultured Caudovirales phage]|uniref:Terminase-like family n=1 Tax=uncultured Caudovirales phage TaxID=2100421 RepID=A0A6J5M2M9_9CAUD|nr:Terminase-like family [uncultured Caudovirales phage]